MTTKRPRAARPGLDPITIGDLCNTASWALIEGRIEDAQRTLGQLALMAAAAEPRPRHRASAMERVAARWARILHERDDMKLEAAVSEMTDAVIHAGAVPEDQRAALEQRIARASRKVDLGPIRKLLRK